MRCESETSFLPVKTLLVLQMMFQIAKDWIEGHKGLVGFLEGWVEKLKRRFQLYEKLAGGVKHMFRK
jgi:hypothetical protein